MKRVQQILSLVLPLMLLPRIRAMQSEEKMDLSPESTIETAIKLCLLHSLINNQQLAPKLGTMAKESTLNPFLVCPVRQAGIECFCRSGYFKSPKSLKDHIKALAGDYRCLECKTLCSGKSSLKNHTCSLK